MQPALPQSSKTKELLKSAIAHYLRNPWQLEQHMQHVSARAQHPKSRKARDRELLLLPVEALQHQLTVPSLLQDGCTSAGCAFATPRA